MNIGKTKGEFGEEIFVPSSKIKLMELKITSEKVLEAASKCSTAKETLKTLFPEVFEPKPIEIESFMVSSNSDALVFIGQAIAPAGYSGKCLVLGEKYNWEVRHFTDQYNQIQIALIPTKKP